MNLSYSSREASTAWKNSVIPSPVTLDTPTDWESYDLEAKRKTTTTDLEMLVKLIQD
jgi:hypothetical protein